MKTVSIKPKEIKRDWYLVDAAGKNLGRLSSEVAQVLRGKRKPFFTPHMNMGDFVVVINADKIAVTGTNKETEKIYWSHSGYPGGGKATTLEQLRTKHPERIIQNSVKGMLPHNRLGRQILKALKVYAGPDHPHAAQMPKTLDI